MILKIKGEVVQFLEIPEHHDKEKEELFQKLRQRYFFNRKSAYERDWSKLICNSNGDYLNYDKYTNCFRLSADSKIKKFSVHWLVMFNCCPEKTPADVWRASLCRKGHHLFSRWTIDHINNIHNDHHPDNLRWLTRKEHSQLTARKYNITKKRHFTKELMEGEFEMFPESDIFKRMADKYENPDLAYIRVTNKGRIRMPHGKYNRGYLRFFRRYDENGNIERYLTSRYRRVKVGRREFSVHVLMMMAKHNQEIPKGYVVMHDDSIPESTRLDEEGGERNFIDDLTIGTTSDNIRSYHKHKKRKISE